MKMYITLYAVYATFRNRAKLIHNMMKQRKIFIIGFNKCGTTSIHGFLRKNGIKSVHWRGNKLAMQVYANLSHGRHILHKIEFWNAYSDIVCIPGIPWGIRESDNYPVIEGCRYFRELHQAYPDALFILNIRDKNNWIKSRLNHDQGLFAEIYLKFLRKEYGIDSKNELVRFWGAQWDDHISSVREYFNNRKGSSFLEYNIEEGDPEVLVQFVGRFFWLPFKDFPHLHKTQF